MGSRVEAPFAFGLARPILVSLKTADDYQTHDSGSRSVKSRFSCTFVSRSLYFLTSSSFPHVYLRFVSLVPILYLMDARSSRRIKPAVPISDTVPSLIVVAVHRTQRNIDRLPVKSHYIFKSQPPNIMLSAE